MSARSLDLPAFPDQRARALRLDEHHAADRRAARPDRHADHDHPDHDSQDPDRAAAGVHARDLRRRVIHRIDLDAGGRSRSGMAARIMRSGPAGPPRGRSATIPRPSSSSAPMVPARYERFDQTLAVIKRAGITRLGFVGNERVPEFRRGRIGW